MYLIWFDRIVLDNWLVYIYQASANMKLGSRGPNGLAIESTLQSDSDVLFEHPDSFAGIDVDLPQSGR